VSKYELVQGMRDDGNESWIFSD